MTKRWLLLPVLMLIALLPFAYLRELRTAHGAPAALRYVAPGGDCGGMSPCYAQVQTAVTAAAPGDEIRIAGGVYTGTHAVSLFNGQVVMTQVVFITQSIQLRGGYALTNWQTSDPTAHPTILDAEGNGRVATIIGGGVITLTGLTLTGGYAEEGGGLYVENDFAQAITLTLQDNAIISNTAGYRGGGLDVRSSSIRATGNVIANNRAAADFGGGGGISLMVDPASFYDISGNMIAHNHTAGTGGGIEFVGGFADEAQVDGNEIMSNTALFGGGLFAYTIDSLRLSKNHIHHNRSQQGGGIGFLSSFNISLESNLIHDNVVTAGDPDNFFVNGEGGGLAIDFVAPLTMTNNVIIGNQAISGDGVSINIDSDVRMFHNTLARNQGSAIQVLGARQPGQHCYTFTFICTRVTMSNTVIVSHAVGISVTGLAISVQADGVLWHQTPITTAVFTTTNTVIEINHFYWGDPLFAPDGYHLLPGSAAVDRGVATAVTRDIDNQLRLQGTAPDLGADELLPPTNHKIYLPILHK